MVEDPDAGCGDPDILIDRATPSLIFDSNDDMSLRADINGVTGGQLQKD